MRRDVSMTDEAVWEMLQRPLTATLSTNGRDGHPHVAAMWYVPAGGELRMATFGRSQKAVNLKRDPGCAFHVESGSRYDEVCGVLVRSSARVDEDPELALEIMCGIYERYRRPHQGPMSADILEQYRRQSHKRVAVRVPLENVASWDHRLLDPSVARRGGGPSEVGAR